MWFNLIVIKYIHKKLKILQNQERVGKCRPRLNESS